MKKIILLLIILLFVCTNGFAQEPKEISDCTIFYSVLLENSKAGSPVVKGMEGSTKVLYFKGSRSRTDLETANFKQTTIYDCKTDSTVVLRELGNTKYISFFNADKRKEKNKRFEGIKFTKTSGHKTILGYECDKVIGILANGSTYDIYYTTSIVPSCKEYEYQFKDLPGFVLEYEEEFEHGNVKVMYTAAKIILTPVPAARFDVPKNGYRIL